MLFYCKSTFEAKDMFAFSMLFGNSKVHYVLNEDYTQYFEKLNCNKCCIYLNKCSPNFPQIIS